MFCLSAAAEQAREAAERGAAGVAFIAGAFIAGAGVAGAGAVCANAAPALRASTALRSSRYLLCFDVIFLPLEDVQPSV